VYLYIYEAFQSSSERWFLRFYAVGDVAPNRDNPEDIFAPVSEFLKSGDLAFCQLETNLTERGSPLPQARLPMRAHPGCAKAIKSTGFDVVSFAGNHCMDWGREAFFDTVDALTANNLTVIGVGKDIKEARNNLTVIGVGKDIKEARKAAIVDIQDTKIAFLAYNTILPMNYWANNHRPGCAPMRALTLYEQIEHDQPGTPARTHTFAHREDLEALIDDIRTARQKADIVILSLHWGIHFVPAVIADYQREVAHAAIDNGADLILGHHAHILKGIEVYKNKVIFYSMGNFAIEPPSAFMENLFEHEDHKAISDLNPEWQPEKKYPMPPDTRKTMIVACDIARTHIGKVAFRPAYINDAFQPELLSAGDSRFEAVVAYVRQISKDQNLSAILRISGDEVQVVTD
jgi:poly-gamma-glutamate synthesis protein (capsule biosynthesis protein)